ncbi:hypothetical protein BT63DRAFT_427855 [Microthyrium microscopicum]|uniref:Uncharacterized protein n=1 Tax=Microthyrium microscopicum TaxID=703497 RepID=A0A6A6U459_9PEZI|nr:hypothetical protein BT63DRAFT_427855 [Microthyrium microscopicum]
MSSLAEQPPALAALKTSALESLKQDRGDDHVSSPSLSTPLASARFEFENGRGNDGTKVLMVEWEDDADTRRLNGTWTVSWEGKPPHVLPAEEKAEIASPHDDDSAPSTADSEVSMRQSSHRLYFFLGPKKSVPATVTLTLTPSDNKSQPIVWKTNPLPAIFPAGLANSKTKNGKGVLHNIWAEKRLEKLGREIQEEAQSNCEGIALQMAISEKEWIEEKFGLATKPRTLNIRPHDIPQSPTSPLSPTGRRLSEKLRGLKLQTVDSPVRPANEEVAVPLCRGKVQKLAAAAESAPAPQPQITAILPPVSTFNTPQTASSLFSIGALLSGQATPSTGLSMHQHAEEEELFALPLSPRSPDMAKSPFSFAAEDTRRYLGAQRA